jgi:threonine/homoserine/homoserine lactone efflux protein
MPEIILVILKGMALGIAVAAPFGPINTEVVRRALRAGFLPAFLLGMGSVMIDIMFASLVLFGFQFDLDKYTTLRETLRFVGGGLLLTLGTILLIQSYRHFVGRKLSDLTQLAGKPLSGSSGDVDMLPGFFRGMMMTFLNPATWGFWFIALPAMASTVFPDRSYAPVMIVAVGVGAGGWIALLAGIFGYLKKHASGTWIAVADLVGALMLLGFGFLVLAYQPG